MGGGYFFCAPGSGKRGQTPLQLDPFTVFILSVIASNMPRRPRINLPGVPQHVIQRGVDKQPVFFAMMIVASSLPGLASMQISDRFYCIVTA